LFRNELTGKKSNPAFPSRDGKCHTTGGRAECPTPPTTRWIPCLVFQGFRSCRRTIVALCQCSQRGFATSTRPRRSSLFTTSRLRRISVFKAACTPLVDIPLTASGLWRPGQSVQRPDTSLPQFSRSASLGLGRARSFRQGDHEIFSTGP